MGGNDVYQNKKVLLVSIIFLCVLICGGFIWMVFNIPLYPTILDYKLFYVLFITFLIPFSISIFLLLRDNYLKRKVKCILITVITVTFVLATLNTPLLFLGIPVVSQTYNISHYLVLDGRVLRDNTYQTLFPKIIPKDAQNQEYCYCYDNSIDKGLDLFAKWSLPESEYEKEKKRVFSIYPNGDSVDNLSSGLTDYYIIGSGTDVTSHYRYLVFSFSDDMNTVQYLYSYADDVDSRLEHPYFYRTKNNLY